MAFAIVPVTLLLLPAIYALWPRFYSTYILGPGHEHLAVERITFIAALAASALLFWAGFRFWKLSAPRDGLAAQSTEFAPWRGRAAAVLTLIVALACFVFAGEEIDWGQWIFGWRTPEAFQPVNRFTNLHNADAIPFRMAADAFILLVVALPVAWLLGLRRSPRLSGLRWAIPEAAVVTSIVLASSMRITRWAYRSFVAEAFPDAARVEAEFLDQVSEQREMLTALALLIYAVYRVRKARSLSRELAS